MVKYTIINYLMHSIDYNYLTKIVIKKLTNKEVYIEAYIDNKNIKAVINMIEANMFIDKNMYKVDKIKIEHDRVIITSESVKYTIHVVQLTKKKL